ncbi:competence type IV pilus minor pilin ComGD [Companilactobacillus mishanensis]|uniref:Type II secretion system protein n=1 Tax=Companilactobacillus mishanensis TaxID=2486008 RepID=A0ABW9P8E0_9LACO|nr:competence type IV pilus minor pilin ComGD [Companilactobacillus mishanensis]MQS45369.1 type II secretion system protein [Companilactobacillus mishanensis]
MILIQRQKSRGFTLVETVLTLFITCLLITIGTLQVKDYQQKTEEAMFFRRFEDDWQNILNSSFLTNKRCYVDFSEAKVIFSFDNRTTTIEVPETLKGNSKHLEVHKSGETSPKTIYFDSTNSKRRYKYTVQMDWGVLIAG